MGQNAKGEHRIERFRGKGYLLKITSNTIPTLFNSFLQHFQRKVHTQADPFRVPQSLHYPAGSAAGVQKAVSDVMPPDDGGGFLVQVIVV